MGAGSPQGLEADVCPKWNPCPTPSLSISMLETSVGVKERGDGYHRNIKSTQGYIGVTSALHLQKLLKFLALHYK